MFCLSDKIEILCDIYYSISFLKQWLFLLDQRGFWVKLHG